jgi:DNA-binding NarL/FixJ family response regulator
VVVIPRRSSGLTREGQLDLGVRPNLLLIDRTPLFLAALGSVLTAPPINAQVEVAHHSDAGLEIAFRGHVHLVFCEIKAYPVSALDVVARLSELTPPVPVILLGEQEDERLLSAALQTGAAGLFTKDATLDEFLVGVSTVLSGHRALGSNLMGHVLARLGDSVPRGRQPSSLLSPTELDILTMIGEAKSVPVIAAARGISHKTVRNHLANIYRKLQLRSRTEAMLCAVRMGLTSD